MVVDKLQRGRTLSGHFQRHAYRHQAISQRTLENIAGAWTAFETNHSPIRFEPAEVVKDGELLEADCWGGAGEQIGRAHV